MLSEKTCVDTKGFNNMSNIIEISNNTFLDYDKTKMIHQLFEEQVHKTPNCIAAIFKDSYISYKELNQKANRLARTLRKKGVKPNSFVALLVNRSIDMLIAIIGVLKAGGAYLPIDSNFPRERIQYILDDSNTNIILTNISLPVDLNFSGDIVNIKDETIFEEDFSNLENVNNSKDIIYTIYTSGSTGYPKGVIIQHRSISNFIIGLSMVIDFSVNKAIVCLTTISFDIFVLETLLPLVRGMKIIIADENEQKFPHLLSSLIINNKVDMLQITPSRLKLFLKANKKLHSLEMLKEIMVGGEAFPNYLLNEVKKLTKAKIYNMYGPTETTVWSTIKELTSDTVVNIGKPIANTKVYILDSNNKILGIGEEGELCIAGDGVAMGYLNRAEGTKDKFLENIFIKGERVYKTGDIARWLPEGDIDYIGRSDSQVKIRGYRIELEEIEQCLISYPQVKDCIVQTQDNDDGNKYLVAYYVADVKIESMELRRFLGIKLPEYMIPNSFIHLERIPLNTSGKIDLNYLKSQSNKTIEPDNIIQGTENETEKHIVKIWGNILNKDQIGFNDNFFQLGGDSVALVQMHTELDLLYPDLIDVIDLFNYPTISKLSSFIEQKKLKVKSLVCDTKLLELPKDYFLKNNEPAEDTYIQYELDEHSYQKLISYSTNNRLDVNSILLSLYIYLLSDISGIDEVSVQIITKEGSIDSVCINLDPISDVMELFNAVNSSYKNIRNNRTSENDGDNLITLNDSNNVVLPIFCEFKNIPSLNVSNNIIIHINNASDILRICFQCNGTRLKRIRTQEFFYKYIKLVTTFI